MKRRARHPLVIAHRGASGYRPEHSRSAYNLAIDLGADAVEPDIVATKDGILVLRHENEISGTTDVASRPEFANRRATKVIDGRKLTGWFTEDFTWPELETLRVRERLPKLRGRDFDGQEGILRLEDLTGLLDERTGVDMVAELKHATHFESIGLPLDELVVDVLDRAGWVGDTRLTLECFETRVLAQLRRRGIGSRSVFLVESSGAPADEVAAKGRDAKPYSAYLDDVGLAGLAASGIDVIGVDKRILLDTDSAGNISGTTDLVDRAHAAGLLVYCWTLRAENQFLGKNLRRPGGPGVFGEWEAEFRMLMASGLDGVFADQPDLAIQARAAL